jgi:hypothetical protein
MRTTEGVGRVPPKPVAVRLESTDIELAWQVATRRNAYRGYASRHDQWGVGLLNETDPVLVGTLGEVAFALWVQEATGLVVPLDDKDRPRGDRGRDFNLDGLWVQVKTGHNRYSDLLVRSTDFTDRTWHRCVRAHWPPRDDPDDKQTVWLCGWVRDRELMNNGKLEPARRGSHTNYALPDTGFHPMRDLAELVKARRTLRG